jgi:hypothetical protein
MYQITKGYAGVPLAGTEVLIRKIQISYMIMEEI